MPAPSAPLWAKGERSCAWRWPAGGILKGNGDLFPWNRRRLEAVEPLGERRPRILLMVRDRELWCREGVALRRNGVGPRALP